MDKDIVRIASWLFLEMLDYPEGSELHTWYSDGWMFVEDLIENPPDALLPLEYIYSI